MNLKAVIIVLAINILQIIVILSSLALFGFWQTVLVSFIITGVFGFRFNCFLFFVFILTLF